MKNKAQELLRKKAKDYHKHHAWRTFEQGVHCPYVFEKDVPYSWWNDVGFILNDRRVMVWYKHPRYEYHNLLEEEVYKRTKELFKDQKEDDFLGVDSFFADAEVNYKKVGRSRKKISSYTMPELSAARKTRLKKRNEIEKEVLASGLDVIVTASFVVKQMSWATGIELCVPIEIKTLEDAKAVAALAKRLLKRETTISEEFKGYEYTKEDWLRENPLAERNFIDMALKG